MRRLIPIFGAALVAIGAGHAHAQDAEAGEKVFNKCRACHVVDQEQNRVGPHLVGLFGRDAGAVEDYRYSDALKESGITWDDQTLAALSPTPRATFPATRWPSWA